MILLTDGTVMAQGSGGGAVNTWYQLKPNSSGSYVNGTWSQLPSMNTPRLYFASNVLPSGKVFVQGGEYTDQGQVFTNTGEIYDPVAQTWTPIATFPQSAFGDDPSLLMSDGRVLTGYISGPQTYFYDPVANQWSQGATKLNNDQSDEEAWVKLPDGGVLSYSIFASINSGTPQAQRYSPGQQQWNPTGNLPAQLSSSAVGEELGPGFLLPDGRVFQLGANGNTALYTPATNTWKAGPRIPSGQGADDAPGAMLTNGNVLFAADHPLFNGPTRIYEYLPAYNLNVSMPTPSGMNSLLAGPSFTSRMLDLPTGQVLFSDNSDSLWVFTPSSGPQAAWQPVVQSVANNGNGTYTLTGTQLNGLSEGAAYGDDAEMASNYPIVQLQDGSGHVYYTRTTNWSLPGQVATGSTAETVVFTPPAGLAAGTYNLYSVANGISSAAFSFNYSPPGGNAVTPPPAAAVATGAGADTPAAPAPLAPLPFSPHGAAGAPASSGNALLPGAAAAAISAAPAGTTAGTSSTTLGVPGPALVNLDPVTTPAPGAQPAVIAATPTHSTEGTAFATSITYVRVPASTSTPDRAGKITPPAPADGEDAPAQSGSTQALDALFASGSVAGL
jgi:hypothetical protein